MEEVVGSRTDIIVANEANRLQKAPPPAQTTKPRCVVTYIKTPSLSTDAKWQAPFFEWVGDTPLFLSTGPEILSAASPKRKRGYSMGTYAIASLPYWLSIDRLFVTGFTMFGAVSGGSHHYCKPPARVSETWHDAEVESRVLSQVLSALPCELTVTDEVAQIIESNRDNARRLAATRSLRPHSSIPWLWYLLERASKGMLTTGYGLRRIAERQHLPTR